MRIKFFDKLFLGISLWLLFFFIPLASNAQNSTINNSSASFEKTPYSPDSAAPAINATAQSSRDDSQAYAGEFFGVKVPIENYYFVKSVIARFGNRWGNAPQTAKELEDAIWEQLLLSFVAFNQNVTVSDEELAAEITKTLEAERVTFDWKKDKEAYQKWARERLKEDALLFENQLKHLIQLEKLRNQVKEAVTPQILNEEAYQEFLNENSSLSLELVRFESEAEADEFYKKVAGSAATWEREKKKRPKDFVRPGFVTVVFLADIWKIPQDALNKMMARDIGDVYPPRPIYKGYAVFKILEKRPADKSQYKEAKDPAYENVRRKKQYEGMLAWIEQLKKAANIKVYPLRESLSPEKTNSSSGVNIKEDKSNINKIVPKSETRNPK
jgi:hypothetical protein